jgi:hypothetical protein
MSKIILSVAAVVFAGVATQAQVNSTTGSVTEQPSWYSNPKVLAGLKSYNTSGRIGDLEKDNAMQLKSKNEVFLGAKAQSGWGAFGQIVNVTKHYRSETPATKKSSFVPQDKNYPDDASATITHPVMDNGTLKITGQLRQYFPVSDFSVTNHMWQTAYYNYIGLKLKGGFDLFNQITPRFFRRDLYKNDNGSEYSNWQFETYTTVSKKLADWVRVGAGQHSYVETHPNAVAGSYMELYPYADFMLTSGVFAGPRVYFPVAKQNTVYDTPGQASLQNVNAEFFFQAAL